MSHQSVQLWNRICSYFCLGNGVLKKTNIWYTCLSTSKILIKKTLRNFNSFSTLTAIRIFIVLPVHVQNKTIVCLWDNTRHLLINLSEVMLFRSGLLCLGFFFFFFFNGGNAKKNNQPAPDYQRDHGGSAACCSPGEGPLFCVSHSPGAGRGK